MIDTEGIAVVRDGSLVGLSIQGPHSIVTKNLPPAEARQIANALLEAADEIEGMRP